MWGDVVWPQACRDLDVTRVSPVQPPHTAGQPQGPWKPGVLSGLEGMSADLVGTSVCMGLLTPVVPGALCTLWGLHTCLWLRQPPKSQQRERLGLVVCGEGLASCSPAGMRSVWSQRTAAWEPGCKVEGPCFRRGREEAPSRRPHEPRARVGVRAHGLLHLILCVSCMWATGCYDPVSCLGGKSSHIFLTVLQLRSKKCQWCFPKLLSSQVVEKILKSQLSDC